MAKVHQLHTGALLHVRIELKIVKPTVWRLVAVPDSITLMKLHDVIQTAMGWSDTHLHEFDIGGLRYGAPDPKWDAGDNVLPEKRVSLLKALAGRNTLTYFYDFGDGWEHRIKIKHLIPNSPVKRYPVCVAGENACPLEDVGGPYGYAEYLDALADPDHPEHEEMKSWGYDEEFDPTEFDFVATNEMLTAIRV